MDQRAKGGPSLPPPSSPPLLPPAPPQQYPEEEVGGGTRKRREKEGGGAVLEVLIEGRCGAAGQRQLPFPGRERSCTEGNVRLRIGVQTAKRTKKPPRTLEGYECKPTIRTYQRPGRGAAGRGSQEGGGSGQGNSPQEEGDGEQNQGSDPNTTQTRKIHSSSPSSSSSSSSSSTAPTTTTPSSANPQTAPAKQQLPVNLGHKKSDTLPEKPRHPDPPDAHSKLPSPAQMDQATPSDPTASSPHSPLVKDPSGEAGVKGEGGMLNGGVPTVTCHPTRLTKVKGRNQNCSSSAAPTNVNSTTRPPVSSPHQADLAAQDRTSGFSCPPTLPPSTPLLPDQRGAPVADGRHLTSLSRGPLLQSYVGNERGKEEKAKKKKEKDDKARGEKGKGKRGEKGRGKEDRGRNESPKMDRDERGKEGTGMDESGRDMTGKEERNGDEDKEREKPRDLRMNKSPSSTKCKMLSEVQSRKTGTPSPDPDLTSGTGKSDDTGGPSRPTVSLSNPSTASSSSPLTSLPPPSLSLHSSSPPTSPREQDSRPLKKRKTRRPSWTRLVNRAQRLAENPVGPQDAPLVSPQTPTTPQTSPTTPQTPATINSPNLRSAESCLAPSVPPPPSPSSLSPSTSTLVKPRPAGRPPSPTQSHLLTSDPSPSPGPDRPISQARKRGRPKSQTSSLDEPQPRHSPKPIRAKVLPHGHDESLDPHVLNPVLDHSPTLTNPSSPRKRGRPKRLPPSPLLPKQTLQDQNRGTLTPSGGEEGGKDFPSEKGNRQLRMRSIIGEMKRRKRRRLLREMLSGCGGGKEGRGGEGGRENSRGGAGGVCGSATAPSLSSSFGGNLGPQINVSKRGTIYMGKRRGRKPKAPANSNPASQSTLFTSLSGPSLFSSHQPQPHPPLSHPFPSPSLTHSSGAQSPYSDGGCTEPAPSLFLPHTFSLPSPSSSCASPRPLSSSFSSSSSLSPSLKRSSPGQRRHPLFHHPSSRLSSPPLPHPPHPLYPHLPVFPAYLKEATPSPISKSHSKEMLPSDSVIGMDHNTISERGERRCRGRGGVTIGMTSDVTRSVLRTGLGVNLKGQRQPSPSMLLEHPSPVPSPHRVSASPPSPPSASPRHTPPSDLVEPRDRHRHRRRGYECPYTRPPCPCLGHNQRSHLDLCPCLAQNTHKRQKHKRKRKYQHLLMHAHDPDFLSELDDLIGQFSEVRIGRHRDWARAGLGQDLDESGGKRRHSSSLSSQNFRSNVYRINLSGYYSPHPLSYPPHPSFSPLHPHPCHGLPYGSRKPEQRLRCGCPTKPCESLDQGDCGQGRRCALQGFTGHLHPSSLSTPLSSSTTSSTTPMPLGFGYYRGYPLTMAHYPNPHPSYPLPPPHPYAPHLHPPHLLLNPARFHRRRSRQLREAGLGGGGGEDVEVRGEGKRAGVRSCPAGSIPGRSCVCGGSEHKLRHKHRHRPRDRDGKEEEEERVAGSQLRSECTTGSGGSRKTGGQGSAGLMESPWQHRHSKYPSSFFSASAKPDSSSSSERLKHTPLTCLGSSHLSSFGEGWGGRQNPWLRRGELGAGFRPPDPTWGTLTEGQRTDAVGGSEREAGERHTPCHSTFTPPTHTNLFTSSDTSGRGMRSGRDNWRPGSQDGSLRSEEPSQIERRGTGPHYDLSRRQLKWLRTGQSFGAKRGPGRPRKNPLASPLVSPFLSPTSQPNPPTETDVQNRDRNRGRGGGDSVQEVIEAVIQSQRRRRRKRRRIEKEEVEHPSCLQSSGEGAPVTHTPSICTGQTELTQTPSLTPASQSDKGVDQLPRKRFQRAGLYSDDYKTTDPSSQNQLNRERLEYTPGEQDYSLLPAPIHVGKYLRMRRIDFQLPFDVMWLFRHNQLHKEPDVPLTREISSCQPKEKSLSSHQTGVSLPPSPQEECSSPSKKLFPYLDMETMTTSDRVFVLKHRVFLLRNWERVRDRQIRLRRGREGEREKDGGVSSYVATGDNNSHIMSGRQMVVKKVVWTSVPLSDPQCPHNPLNTTPHLTQNRQEEKKQVEEEEEEGWREVRKERLNNILLKLRQA